MALIGCGGAVPVEPVQTPTALPVPADLAAAEATAPSALSSATPSPVPPAPTVTVTPSPTLTSDPRSSPLVATTPSPGALPGEQLQFFWAGPLSGAAAPFGQQYLNGVRLAAEEWNARGGLLGAQIDVTALDDRCDPAQAELVAREIAAVPHTLLVFGHFCSGASLAAAPFYQAVDLPMLTIAPHPRITQQGWTSVFRLGATDDLQARAMVEFTLSRLGARTIAVIDDGQPFGEGFAAVARAEIERREAAVSSWREVDAADGDYRALLTEVLENEQPDAVIFCTSSVAAASQLLVQIRELGFEKPLLGCDGWLDADLLLTAGPAVEQVSEQQAVYIGGPTPSYDSSAALRGFAQRYQDRFGTVPSGYEAHGYDSANLAFSAIQQAGRLERGKVREALAAILAPTVLMGTASFEPNGDVRGAPTFVYAVRGGRFVQVEVVQPPSPPVE